MIAFVEAGAPLDAPCTLAARCGSIARALVVVASGQATSIFVFPGVYDEVLALNGDVNIRGRDATLRGSVRLQGSGGISGLSGFRIEGRGAVALSCKDTFMGLSDAELVGGEGVGIEVGSACFLSIGRVWVTDQPLGGIDVKSGGSLSLDNSVVARNGSPTSRIGGVRTESSFVTLNLSTVVKNRAAPDVACGIERIAGSPQLGGTIVYYNECELQVRAVSAERSNIQGGTALDGNLDLPPMFVDLEAGDYHLSSLSPCINGVPANTTFFAGSFDIDGQRRDDDNPVMKDIGADEYVSALPP